jgi:hypothetical protein
MLCKEGVVEDYFKTTIPEFTGKNWKKTERIFRKYHRSSGQDYNSEPPETKQQLWHCLCVSA